MRRWHTVFPGVSPLLAVLSVLSTTSLAARNALHIISSSCRRSNAHSNLELVTRATVRFKHMRCDGGSCVGIRQGIYRHAHPWPSGGKTAGPILTRGHTQEHSRGVQRIKRAILIRSSATSKDCRWRERLQRCSGRTWMLCVKCPEPVCTTASTLVSRAVVSENLGLFVKSRWSLMITWRCPERTASCSCDGVVTTIAPAAVPGVLTTAFAAAPSPSRRPWTIRGTKGLHIDDCALR